MTPPATTHNLITFIPHPGQLWIDKQITQEKGVGGKNTDKFSLLYPVSGNSGPPYEQTHTTEDTAGGSPLPYHHPP